MCLGIPMKLLAIDGIKGTAEGEQGVEIVDLSLTPDAVVGDWVLNFLGAAREVLPEDEARKIQKALGGLWSLMNGGGLGDAFADLEETGPRLPPHLQAALDAGKTTV